MDSQLFTISRQGAPLHVSLSTKSFEFGIEEEDGVKKPRRKSSVTETLQDTNYHWEEWKPVYQEEKSTKINIPGKKNEKLSRINKTSLKIGQDKTYRLWLFFLDQAVTDSCAFKGRIAVAYCQSQRTFLEKE